MTRHAPAWTPRLLSRGEAALYLAVSPNTLATLEIPRKRIGTRVLYDRADLDAFAAALPYEGEGEANTCDAAFGTAAASGARGR